MNVGTELISISLPSPCHSYSHRCLSQWSPLVGGSLNSEGRSGPQDYLKPSKAKSVYNPWRRWVSVDSECLCSALEQKAIPMPNSLIFTA